MKLEDLDSNQKGKGREPTDAQLESISDGLPAKDSRDSFRAPRLR